MPVNQASSTGDRPCKDATPATQRQLSQVFEPVPGDLVFSGTPEDVGPVVPGDLMAGSMAGLPGLSVTVVA